DGAHGNDVRRPHGGGPERLRLRPAAGGGPRHRGARGVDRHRLRCCRSACPLPARLQSSDRRPRPSDGGTRGRQVTQVEGARPEAEERRTGTELGGGEVEAGQPQPGEAVSGEGRKVARVEKEPAMAAVTNKTGKPL